MTKITRAFRVGLSEGQGSVCLTEEGLRVLRAKIDYTIGIQLPDRRPAGISLDEWDKFQGRMAAERDARLAQEAENARLRGKTDAETARAVGRPGGPLMFRTPCTLADVDPRVAEWEKVGFEQVRLFSQFNPFTGNQEFVYSMFGKAPEDRPGGTWKTWAALGLIANRTWTEVRRHPGY